MWHDKDYKDDKQCNYVDEETFTTIFWFEKADGELCPFSSQQARDGPLIIPEISHILHVEAFIIQIKIQAAWERTHLKNYGPYFGACHPTSLHGEGKRPDDLEHTLYEDFSYLDLYKDPSQDAEFREHLFIDLWDAIVLFNGKARNPAGTPVTSLLLIEWQLNTPGVSEVIGTLQLPKPPFDRMPKSRRRIRLRWPAWNIITTSTGFLTLSFIVVLAQRSGHGPLGP